MDNLSALREMAPYVLREIVPEVRAILGYVSWFLYWLPHACIDCACALCVVIFSLSLFICVRFFYASQYVASCMWGLIVPKLRDLMLFAWVSMCSNVIQLNFGQSLLDYGALCVTLFIDHGYILSTS